MAQNPKMRQESSSGRTLAVGALIAVTLAVIVIAATSVGGSDSAPVVSAPPTTTSRSSGGSGSAEGRGSTGTTGTVPQSTYVVKPGDNFEGIASKTGIPTDKLLKLNPDLDPQALISGQKVRLR